MNAFSIFMRGRNFPAAPCWPSSGHGWSNGERARITTTGGWRWTFPINFTGETSESVERRHV